MIEINNIHTIAISSLICSLISIISTIASIISRKKILDSSGCAIVGFDITGQSIVDEVKVYKNQIMAIRRKLATYMGLPNERFVEMMRPEHIPNGLRFRIIIHINRITARNIDYKKLLDKANQNGQLQEIVKSSWRLNHNFAISEIYFAVKESKIWIANTININIDTGSNDHVQNNDHNLMEGNNDFHHIQLESMPQVNIGQTNGIHTGEEEESDDSDQTQNWVTENDKMRGPGNNINDEDENENEDIIDAINKTRAEDDIDQQNEGDIQVINVDEYGR